MEKNLIIFVFRHTSFGFGNLYLEQLSAAFRLLDYQTVHIDLQSSDAGSQIELAVSQKARIAFGVSIPFGFFAVNTTPFPYLIDAPMFMLLVDHPAYKMGLPMNDPLAVVGCSDPSHVGFLQRHVAGAKAFHLPHFDVLPFPLSAARVDDKAQGLFFSGCMEIMERKWSASVNQASDCDVVEQLLRYGIDVCDILDNQIFDESAPLDMRLEARIQEWGQRSGNTVNTDDFLRAFVNIDIAVRALRRRRTIEALDGIDLTIVGPGWEHCNWLKTHSAKILPQEPYLECEDHRRQFAISLDIGQGQPQAGHDRFINAARIAQPVLGLKRPFLDAPANAPNVFACDIRTLAEDANRLLKNHEERYALGHLGLQAWTKGQWAPLGAANTLLRAFNDLC